MRLSRLPHRLLHISRKSWYRNRTTYPRISADAFRDICDVSFYSSGDKSLSRMNLREAQVVYCNSDFIDRFIEEDLKRFSPKVLLVGNSDRDFTIFDFPAKRGLKAVFLQNSVVREHRVYPLPIGLENLSIAMNSRPTLFGNQYLLETKSEQVLIGPFGKTHPSRKELLALETFNSELIEFRKDFVSQKKYAEMSSRFRYVACPRGNGLDTHRFWETLYRGGLPIVIDGEWSKNMKKLGLPVISINSWDLELISEAMGLNPYQNFMPLKIESLWMPFWEKWIKSSLG